MKQTILSALSAVGVLMLICCGPSEAELERRAREKIEHQNQQEAATDNKVDNKIGKLVSSSDSSVTTFKIPTDYGSTCYGRLITVKHDGCEFIVWFNQWGQQTMHKPNCSNPYHIK